MTTIVEPNPVGVVNPTRVRWRPPKLTPPLVIKSVVGAVVLGGLVYFVGGQVLLETAIKIAVAVGISIGLFIGANKLFDLAYPRWALFAGLAGAGIGFIAFFLLDGNRALRDLPARPWLWGLIGAVALGAAGLVLNTPSTSAWKLPMSVVTFAALGVLIGVAMNDSVLPEIAWGKFALLTAIGIAVGVGWRALRSKGDARQLPRVALMGAAVGAVLGGWGCADLGDGTTAQAIVASVVPLTLLGIRIGLQPLPAATTRREVEQRSRSWIFLIPAIFFVVAGLVVPLIRTIYLSFHDRAGVEYVGMDNFKRVFDDKGFWNTTRSGVGRVPPLQAVLDGGGVDRAGRDRRGGLRPPHAPRLRLVGRRLRAADVRLLPVVVFGARHAARHAVQQHLVGHRGDRPRHLDRARRRRARRPLEG